MNLMPPTATLLLPFRNLSNGEQALRVGVVLDRDQPTPWVDALLGFLRQIPGIDARFLPVTARSASKLKRPGWLVEHLYSMSRAKFDPFGDVAFGAGGAGAGTAHPEAIDAIRAANCGLIIWLAGCECPDVEVRNLAKHGVFTVRLGDRDRVIPFWDEVADNRTTSTATVYWHDVSLSHGRAVRKAETSTSLGLYVTTNAEQPLAAAIRMLAALCMEIQRGGSQFEVRVRGLTIEPTSSPAPPAIPSNFEAARFLAAKLTRSAQLRRMTRGKTAKWFIAMRLNQGQSITDAARLDLTGFKDIPLPPGVQAIADPFVWEADGKSYLLFEEIAAGQGRGRLGCVELLPDGSCSEMKIILAQPYHLSYPCVVPLNDELFLLPETSEANRVDIYRFSRFPWEMELVASPVEELALVDTTPIFIDGYWYFFTTTIEPFMETLLFWATRLEGPWNLHPCNPVSTSVRNSRSAGHLFWRGGRLFRPTQDCSVRYGYAMAVNEVTKLTTSEFEEHQVSYVAPAWAPELLGTHTWNESSQWQVLDGIRLVSDSGSPQAR